jgi:hypothetical protein
MKKTNTSTTAEAGAADCIQPLGIPAVLPSPEEEKDLKTEISAARVKQARDQML